MIHCIFEPKETHVFREQSFKPGYYKLTIASYCASHFELLIPTVAPKWYPGELFNELCAARVENKSGRFDWAVRNLTDVNQEFQYQWEYRGAPSGWDGTP